MKTKVGIVMGLLIVMMGMSVLPVMIQNRTGKDLQFIIQYASFPTYKEGPARSVPAQQTIALSDRPDFLIDSPGGAKKALSGNFSQAALHSGDNNLYIENTDSGFYCIKSVAYDDPNIHTCNK